MAIISLSAAAVLIYQFGRPVGEGLSLGLALMCVMIMLHVLFARSHDRGDVNEAVERLEYRLGEIDEDVNNLEGRLTGVETTIPRRTREEIDPLFAEVEVLGSLVKQMAEAMSDMEVRIDEQEALPRPPLVPGLQHQPQQQMAQAQISHAPSQAALQQSAPYQQAAGYGAEGSQTGHATPQDAQGDYSYRPQQQPPLQPQQQAQPYQQAPQPAAPQQQEPQPRYDGGYAGQANGAYASDGYGSGAYGQDRERIEPSFGAAPEQPAKPRGEPRPDPAMRELIRAALNSNRVDLYLQPVVTLPQRRVKYYEALTRLRDANGEVLEANVFMPEAVRAGLLPRIDNLLLFRSVQVVRRLASRSREVALFCNVSSFSLVDDTFFPGFLEFVRANRNFSEALIFEFTQEDVAQMGAMEYESLEALAELGFSFSVDQISDLKMDFKALADHGFRFAKLQADYVIGRKNVSNGHIHPADFADLLQRYGIDLIADHVETESQVLELLDYDVKFAQGFLFSPPRPVRAEILQGAPAPGARPARTPGRRNTASASA